MGSLANLLRLPKTTRCRTVLIAMAVLLALGLIGPFLVPVRPLEGTVCPQTLADPDSRFISVNGLQVHYKTGGAGEPVLVLLHGFGASVFSWREVMKPLAELGTVVAYDRPAFGLTQRPLTWEEDANPYTSEAQVELLIGLMDTLEFDSTILVGNSAGGAVALRAALEYADRVEALVLVSAAIYEGGGAPAWTRPLLDTPQLDRLGPLLTRQISQRGDAFLHRAWHEPNRITPDIRTGYRKPLAADNWDRALWELAKGSPQRGLADRIGDIAVPSLVVTGDDDRIVPVESSIRLAEDLPAAELLIISDCGHLPQEECPDQFLVAVTAFVQSLSE